MTWGGDGDRARKVRHQGISTPGPADGPQCVYSPVPPPTLRVGAAAGPCRGVVGRDRADDHRWQHDHERRIDRTMTHALEAISTWSFGLHRGLSRSSCLAQPIKRFHASTGFAPWLAAKFIRFAEKEHFEVASNLCSIAGQWPGMEFCPNTQLTPCDTHYSLQPRLA